MLRIGQGYDVHKLVEGRELIIGGVKIPYHKGLLGHSDADVLLHALTDAILGAVALGDIGRWFPDNDPILEGVDSKILIKKVWSLVKQKGFSLGNADITIIAQEPKMAEYIPKMRENIASLLECELDQVNIKATTTEKLGYIGRGEGIASQAVILLSK